MVIPLVLEGKDLIVKAQTGSGKTAAFAIPLIERISWDNKDIQALVLSPTRELALQVSDDFYNIARYKKLNPLCIYGKESFEKQKIALKLRNHIVVATPGRLIDHIEHNTIDLSKIKYLVIDEADEMFKMGFLDQITTILDALPSNIQMILVSATFNSSINNLTKQFMNKAMFIESTEEFDVLEQITQEYYYVEEDNKLEALSNLIITNNPSSTIIFCNTKLVVDEVCQYLKDAFGSTRALHGGMYQKDRIQVINDFKQGKFRFLVASDVAARGIDIEKVALVINYELPQKVDAYIHRIGRTGRANNEGKAMLLVTKNERLYLNNILDKIDLNYCDLPNNEEVSLKSDAFNQMMRLKPTEIKVKGSDFKKEIVKLYINAGKKNKIRTGDIVGAITNINGITFDDIGIIKIDTTFSLVDILNNKGNVVIEALETNPIKGKIRQVSISRKY